MELNAILTKRKINKRVNWDLIYEWENVISKELNIPFIFSNRIFNTRLVKIFPTVFNFLMTNRVCLKFDMMPSALRVGNKKNIIPWIIDFYPTEEMLQSFYRNYSKNPLVFISSKQVYQYLVNKRCPLPIRHLALSLSEKYRLTSDVAKEKKYNLIVTGRKNPVLMDYLRQYIEEFPDFQYIYRKQKDGHQYFYTSTGECLGTFDGREEYMSLLRSVRIAFYSTSGVDGDRKETNGFNQVTPRFLEFLASGCYVISRYEDNEDTEYYEMDKYSMRATDYNNFKKIMHYVMHNEFDYERVGKYLEHHYTYSRAKELREMLNDL